MRIPFPLCAPYSGPSLFAADFHADGAFSLEGGANGLLYVLANNGILDAYDLETGQEIFAIANNR